ncbi:MAG: GNAT family N-acetyltransferase [Myxococcota bacterium]|nr:GNAT family N-acetyltransferase [Myxococcota bacterium]
MEIRKLQVDDCAAMWRINEEGLPGVGKVTQASMEALLDFSILPLGMTADATLAGFVLCLLPGTQYGSPNYRWFHERYDSFLYVDRIAVGAAHRNRQIGSRLYGAVFDYAATHDLPIAAEVSLQPPNPGSMRFHGRHGFKQVGELNHPSQSVAMMMRG